MHVCTGLRITEALLKEPKIQQLRKSNQTFDAVISEVFLNEAHFGFAEHFKAPLIGLGTFGAISWNTDLVGSQAFGCLSKANSQLICSIRLARLRRPPMCRTRCSSSPIICRWSSASSTLPSSTTNISS